MSYKMELDQRDAFVIYLKLLREYEEGYVMQKDLLDAMVCVCANKGYFMTDKRIFKFIYGLKNLGLVTEGTTQMTFRGKRRYQQTYTCKTLIPTQKALNLREKYDVLS